MAGLKSDSTYRVIRQCFSALPDGRFGWKVLKGKVAFGGIMTPEAKHWALMPLPKTEHIEEDMREIEEECSTFCKIFRWIEAAFEKRQR